MAYLLRKRKPLRRAVRASKRRRTTTPKRRRARSMIPMAPKTKQFNYLANLTSRSLQDIRIDNITTGALPSERERNILKIVGLKIRNCVRNNTTTPYVYRWAVVTPKRHNTSTNLPQNFFKAFDDEQAHDFSTARSGIEMISNPIDRTNYTVHAQGKINVAGTTINQGATMTEKFVNKKVKLALKKTYDIDANTVPFESTWFVFWCDTPFSAFADPVAAAVLTSGLELDVIWHEAH